MGYLLRCSMDAEVGLMGLVDNQPCLHKAASDLEAI
jgi:hypothetical protein